MSRLKKKPKVKSILVNGEALEKANDFVMKNAGRDYEDRLRWAKDLAAIWNRGK